MSVSETGFIEALTIQGIYLSVTPVLYSFKAVANASHQNCFQYYHNPRTSPVQVTNFTDKFMYNVVLNIKILRVTYFFSLSLLGIQHI